jgi:uncharacterized membrane protein
MTTTRLESFSDGVFAIAITLLVLLIRIPSAGEGSLAHALGRLWPSYAAYVVSFFTIGIIWVNHHAQFERIARVDRRLLFLNLFLLMWVSLLPFPTALVADFLRAGTDEGVATAVYAGALLAMSLSFYSLWRHARTGRLLAHELPETTVRSLTRRNMVGHVGYAAALAIAFVSPLASLAICAGVAFFYAHPGRRPATVEGG